MNQTDQDPFDRGIVNRYWQTFRSLTGNIVIIWIGVLFVLINIGCSIFFWLSAVPLTVLAIACCLGLGHLVYLFQQSERRRLVPSINLACANVSIGLAIAMWILIEMMATLESGFFVERAGVCLLLIAFALWIGWGERFAVFAIASPIVPLLAIFFVPQGPEKVFFWYRGLPAYGHTLIGLVLVVAAFAILLRYWLLASSELELTKFRKLDQIFQSQKSIRERLVSANEFADSSDKRNKLPSVPAEVSSSSFARIQEILYGKPYISRRAQLFLVFISACTLLFLFCVRGKSEVSAAFSCLAAALLVLTPSAFFSMRVPQSFRRLWVMGVAESRSDTVASMLLLTARRTIPVYLLMIAILLVQVSWQPMAVAKMLFVLTAGLAVGGFFLWSISKWYVSWAGGNGVPQLFLMAILMTGFVFLMPFSISLSAMIEQAINSLGIVPSLLSVGVVTVIIWLGSISDASKSLGRSSALCQCETKSHNLIVMDVEMLG